MNSKEKKYENMTPLEALEWIDAYSEDDVYHNITNEVNIIKKALSRLEQLEKKNQELRIKNTRLKDYKINYRAAIAFMQAQKEEMQKVREENTKLKQVIKILKEHFELFYNKNTDTYEIKADLPLSTIISKVTYELLKSVLEEE